MMIRNGLNGWNRHALSWATLTKEEETGDGRLQPDQQNNNFVYIFSRNKLNT